MDKLQTNISSIFDSNTYIVTISKDRNPNIIIESKIPNIKLCGNLAYDVKNSNIKVNMISKCYSSGTLFLSKLENLAQLLNIKYIHLEDKSNLVFDCNKKIKIDLSLLYILSTGKSWYNSKGYFSSNYENEFDNNSKIINKTMEELLHSVNYPAFSEDSKNKTVSEYFSEVKSSLVDEPNCKLIVWLEVLCKKMKKNRMILYNVNLSKRFTLESEGGMKRKKYTTKFCKKNRKTVKTKIYS